MMYLDSIPFGRSIAVGCAVGVSDFLFTVTCQKVCMFAKLKIEPIDKDLNDLATQIAERKAVSCVLAPVIEELLFRGALQSLVKKVVAFCVPYFGKTTYAGLPISNLTSAIVAGSAFGVSHISNFKEGGWIPALSISVGGCVYGIAKEYFGLPCSITAHMIHNYLGSLVEDYYPEFFETPEETALRRKVT